MHLHLGARSQPSTSSRQCRARQSTSNFFSTVVRGVPGLGLSSRRALQQEAGSKSALPLTGARRKRSCHAQAVQRQGESGSSQPEHHGSSTDGLDVPDIWAPVPPTPALGRKRKVAALIAAAMLEITLTGTLVWSPVLTAVALAVLQPTKAEIQQQQEEAVKQAVAAAEVQAYRHLPVTPVESAAWLNRLNQEMWATFWQPFLLANNLSSWQDTVSAAAPRGWEVEIADVSIGTLAPQMSGFQAFADPDTGAVTAVDADISFSSNSVVLVVVGRGPLGAFTAKVSAVQLEGHVRIIPLLQHRMLLLAFKHSPSVRVSLSLSAPLFKTALSPGDLGQLNFIQGLIGSAIKDQLVEPRRMAVSLDSDIRVEQAVSTTLHINIDSITGLPTSLLSAVSGGSGGAPGQGVTQVALVLMDTTTQVRRSSRAVTPNMMRRAAQLQQQLSLELRRKQGLYRLEARAVAPGQSGRVSVSRGQLLGSCLLWVAAARDGTTLFWSHDRSGAPLATRWSPASNRPWQATLPLDPEVPGAQGMQVNVGVAVEPWVYKAGLSPDAPGTHRTPGPRVVILQVVEARGLVTPAGVNGPQHHGPTTHVQVAYGQDMYSTSTQYGTSSPIFDEVFALQEQPGIISNRIKLEVWQEDAPAASATAGTTSSTSSSQGSHNSGSSSGSRSQGNSSTRRVLVPSSRRAGFKAVNKLRHSNNIKTGSSASSSRPSTISSSSSSVASYQLRDVEAESESADPESHMLVDLQLQDEPEGYQGAPGGSNISSSGTGGDSGSTTGGAFASLGSVSIQLDQLTEALVQDRWYELSGTDGGQVRLRLAVVPGLLPQDAHSSSSRRRHTGWSDTSEDASHMLAFFHKQLQRSSRDSIKVEVVSARLYLPLSSMDSSDIDQPSYVLSYAGRATLSTPPYSRPTRARPSSRSSSSDSSWSRPSGGASRAARSSDISSRELDIATNSMFEDVTAGNVSQQVIEGSCLARAVFPLHPDSSTQAPAAGVSEDGGSSAAAAGAASIQGNSGRPVPHPHLKVLLFDPEDLSHASPAAAAAAITAAAKSSRAGGQAISGPAAAESGTDARSSPDAAAAASSGPASHSILLSSASSGSDAAGVSDIGGVEVDVQQLLAAARQGQVGGAAAAGVSVEDGITVPSTAAAACWEGWVKLDKDGGHLLLRLTQLSASEPADLVPPIITSSTTADGTRGTSSPSSGDQRVAAAAAAVAGATASAAGSLSSSIVSAEEEVEGLQDRLTAALKQSVSTAQGQVGAVAHQLGDATSVAAQWINSSSSWLSNSVPSWATSWRSSSSTNAGTSQQPQQQRPAAATEQDSKPAAQQPEGKAARQQKHPQAKQQAAANTGSAGPATAGAGHQLQRQQQQQHQRQEQKQQQEPVSSFGVDLRFISRALGLGGTGSSSSSKPSQQKATQRQQQQQELAMPVQAQQQAQMQQQQAQVVSSGQQPLQAQREQQDPSETPSSSQPQPTNAAGTGAAPPDTHPHAVNGNGRSGSSSSSSSNGSDSTTGGSAASKQPQLQLQPQSLTNSSPGVKSTPQLLTAQQPQPQSALPHAAATCSSARSSTSGGSTAKNQQDGQRSDTPAAAATGVAAAAAAAAVSGPKSHALGGGAADVWGYDGFGDEGQEGVTPGAEWEGAQEPDEF